MQVILALASGEIIYFELTQTGQLLEVEKKEIAGGVACIDVAPVPEGYQRSRFLAVGSHDSTVSGLWAIIPSIHCALHSIVTPWSAHSIRGSWETLGGKSRILYLRSFYAGAHPDPGS